MKDRFLRYRWHLIRKVKKFNDSVIVDGLGRCGTTLLEESLISNHYYSRPDSLYMDRFHEIREFKNGIVYKTHDYPPDVIPKPSRVIYLFGNPMNIALSAHRKMNQWGKEHHFHLVSDDFEPNNSIIFKDTLHLENHFNAWYRTQNFDFLSLRYEALYKQSTIEAISEFLGFKINLFPERQRNTNWEKSKFIQPLSKIYGGLNQKILAAEDVKLWKSNHS